MLFTMKTRSPSRSSNRRTSSRSSSKTSRRQLVSPRGSKRYVRRTKSGQFKKNVSVGRSLSADRRSKSSRKVKKGQGDRGDR
jgi:hypothetical protein